MHLNVTPHTKESSNVCAHAVDKYSIGAGSSLAAAPVPRRARFPQRATNAKHTG